MQKNNTTLLKDVIIIRFILIILLVLYHSFAIYNGAWQPPHGVEMVKVYKWIAEISYSFMLETYVFVSGYVLGFQTRTKYKYKLTYKICVCSKFRRLLIPSIVFSIFYLLCFGLDSDVNIIYSIINGLGHMWFLPMLFWCFIGIYLMESIQIKPIYMLTFALIISFFTFLELPFRLDYFAYYFFFFVLGYTIQKYNISIFHNLTHYIIIILLFYIVFFSFSRYLLSDESILLLKETSLIANIAYVVILRIVKIAYALAGLLFVFSGVNYLLNKNGCNVSKIFIKISSTCFGVYVFQQFILKYLYYNTSFFDLFGNYLAPWFAFIFTLLLSIALSICFQKTSIGKYLIG